MLVAGLLATPLVLPAEAVAPRERLLMDRGWKFHLGNEWGAAVSLAKAGSSGGPARMEFNDTGWRTVNLPHDWVVELPFDAKADVWHGCKPVGPGFPQNSVGWYRRTFTLPKEDSGRRIRLEFDGVYRDCLVFLNGYLLGRNESGYSSFRHDITDVASCGGKNVLAVRVDASQFEGWFYEGAGIYRHVWMVKTGPLSVAPDATFVQVEFPSGPPPKPGPASVRIATRLVNSQDRVCEAAVKCEILGPDGKAVDQVESRTVMEPWADKELKQTATVASPLLWSPEAPRIYRVAITVATGGKVADRFETEFGIRTVGFGPDNGFLLNGTPYTIKGTCNHQDHAGVGSALPDRLQYFRIERLKAMGCNAYRCSHNPPTPELLEACDRLGMLVMDENRLMGSDPESLGLLERLVLRDRNHPSVFVWSLGNEEGAIQATATGGRVAESMNRLVKRLDPTRPTTYAANLPSIYEGANRFVDVRGWNYHLGEPMDSYHKAHPTQPNVGTEQASTLCTRGIYAVAKEAGYMSAYDDTGPGWGNTAERWWTFFAERPWLSGGFVWTGFDYRGEPTPYEWPCINSHFGIMDTCGFPKDNFFYYQAWWGDRTVLHVLPHWTWPGKEGQEIDVRCFSNCDDVELLLDGRSLGRKTMPRNSHLRWKVAYAPGTLSAIGYRAGQPIVGEKVETAGAPSSIILVPDRGTIDADGEDLSIVTVAIADAEGRVVPTARRLVKFEVEGPGKIIGVGNGDPSCHEPDVTIENPPVRTVDLGNWRMKGVPDAQAGPETGAEFDDSAWTRTDVRRDVGPLDPGRCGVFRTRFELKDADLAVREIKLSFGMIDDDGWVYVNGQLVGESHDWTSSPMFDVGKVLRPGQNTVAVVIKNNEGRGGVNKGVNLLFQEKPVVPDWKRSTFNGLAQVIVQASRNAGNIQLTARSPDLSEAALTIQSRTCSPRPFVP